MTDDRISDLFAEGTAPDADPAFVLGVAAGIDKARLGARLQTLGPRAAVVLALAGAIYVAAAMIRPLLAPLMEDAPQFMGVPAPVVLGVLVAGLVGAMGVRLSPFDAGARFPEPID